MLNIAILSPLIAWSLDAIVRTAGAAAITNADLVAFALSPAGIAFLLATGTVHLATLQAQAGGLTLLAADVAAGRRPSLQDAITRKARRLPAFLKLSLLQTAVILALVAGLAAGLVGLRGWLLGDHDINYYLSERPPEWQVAILLAGGMGTMAAVGLVWLLARWLFAVPMLLLGNLGPLACRPGRAGWP